MVDLTALDALFTRETCDALRAVAADEGRNPYTRRAASETLEWIEDHPGMPRALRDWMRSESDRAYGAEVRGAETPEAQAAVVMVTIGQVLTAMAAVLPVERISHELAAQLIAIGEKHMTAMAAWLARLRQRVVTRGHRAAGGAS